MNNPFGGLFDFNGDGKVDPAEELAGLDMLGFFCTAANGEDEDEDDEDEDGDENGE